MTTLMGFVTALQGTPLGMKAFLGGPPAKLNPGDLPVCWINAIGVSEAPVARSGNDWPTFRAELFAAVSPIAQDTRAANFARAVELAEAVKTALRDADLAIGPTTVEVKVSIITVAQVDHWGITATVEAQG